MITKRKIFLMIFSLNVNLKKMYNRHSMKRTIPVVFILVATFLALFLIGRNIFNKDSSISRARVVTPVVDSQKTQGENDGNEYEDSVQKSFIELANDETLLSVVTMDIDGDGFDDQINIVKTSKSPFISLIVGLYNPSTSSYLRAVLITTNVSQTRTFACTSLDVIGNHKNSLVYQGIMDNGNSVLCIFNGSRNKKNEFVLTKIADFESDGTIFIQQFERNEAYELSRTRAASFPVWVYSSDSSEDSTSLDQIQTLYDWNENEGKYVSVRQIKVTGSKIAARELERIQDGTVATFAEFLDGLWYKTDMTGSVMRYIFFNYQNQEIIFHYEDSEEVYSWLNSNLRRNGIYFSSVNKSIENLQRRFDISLVNVDEIRVRIQDDVRMIIGENTLWDGNYKKLSEKSVDKVLGSVTLQGENAIKRLVEGQAWLSGDLSYIVFTKDGYSVDGEKIKDKGRFLVNKISSSNVLQFKSETSSKYFNGYYSISFAKITKTQTLRNGKLNEILVDDTDTLILQPVVVNPSGFFPTETQPIILKKTQVRKTDE